MITARIILFFCIIFGLLGCEDSASNDQYSDDSILVVPQDSIDLIRVECDLVIRIEGEDKVYADLTFNNKSKIKLRLLKWKLLLNGEMTFSAFNILRDNQKIFYKGPMVYHDPPTEADYYLLAPNSNITTSVKLKDYYDLSSKVKYTISYFSYNYLEKLKVLFIIESNIVEFSCP